MHPECAIISNGTSQLMDQVAPYYSFQIKVRNFYRSSTHKNVLAYLLDKKKHVQQKVDLTLATYLKNHVIVSQLKSAKKSKETNKKEEKNDSKKSD